MSFACSGTERLVRRDMAGLAWFGPASASQQLALARWRASVGPPVVRLNVTTRPAPSTRLTVVSWNTAVGDADIAAFVRDRRRETGDGAPLVMLLQEVYRRGAAVPRQIGSDASFASRLGIRQENGTDVEAVAAGLGLNVYYVPSMRNGGPLASDEDRGNAIMSNLPLTELSAIELPFERQRRVAVGATVSGEVSGARQWRLRVVSVHLDNMVGPRRLWFAGGEYARARQIRAVLDHVAGDAEVMLGGDLNTWFGFADAGYLTAARAFPAVSPTDRRGTFHGLLRLDHLFFRLPAGWHAEYRRGDRRYGSDHYPLIGTIAIR